MTKNQANLIIAGILAMIVIQLITGAMAARSQAETRKALDGVETSAGDVLEMQKTAAGRPSLTLKDLRQ